MGKLEQTTAIITGASSGIGRGIALAFAGEGARLVISCNRARQSADAVAATIAGNGGEAAVIQADLSDKRGVDQLIRQSQTVLGGIDILVNNAGADILTGAGNDWSTQKKMQTLLDVDLKGTINACWSVLPIMQTQDRGVILNMSWDLAIHGFAGINPQIFAAAKAGILGFSRSLAKSCGPNIRVNVLSPGWIETAFAKNNMDKDYYQARINEIPLGRFGTPEDVAAAAVFLASDAATYITGESIRINGGLI